MRWRLKNMWGELPSYKNCILNLQGKYNCPAGSQWCK